MFDLSLVPDGPAAKGKFVETTLSNQSLDQLKTDNPGKITGRWTLSYGKDGAKGEWSTPDGAKKLPIVLKRAALIPAEGLGEYADRISSSYNALWSRAITFGPTGESTAFGPVSTAMVTGQPLGVAYPRFTAFPDAQRMAKINAFLEAKHRESIEGYRDCRNGTRFMGDGGGSETEAPEFAFRVVFASSEILTLEEAGSVFCGGAHPSNYVTNQTYVLSDLTQIGGGGPGEQDISPERFGRFMKFDTPEEREAFAKFWWSRWFAGATADKEMGADCAGGSEAETNPVDLFPNLAVTAEGITVRRTDYGHAMSVCIDQPFNPC